MQLSAILANAIVCLGAKKAITVAVIAFARCKFCSSHIPLALRRPSADASISQRATYFFRCNSAKTLSLAQNIDLNVLVAVVVCVAPAPRHRRARAKQVLPPRQRVLLLSESRAQATVPLGTTMLSFRLFFISTSCELPSACFAHAIL
jgi:hypothetical protein